MKKQWRRLLFFMVMLAVLATPGVHWRLIGWVKGEPFWHGRPTSYWSAEIEVCETTFDAFGCGFDGKDVRPLAYFLCLRRRSDSTIDRILWRLAVALNQWEWVATLYSPPFSDCETSAIPVLTGLLCAPNPTVRYFAAQKLGSMKESATAAKATLLKMTGDSGVVRIVSLDGAFTGEWAKVADSVVYALHRIDPQGWQATPAR